MTTSQVAHCALCAGCIQCDVDARDRAARTLLCEWLDTHGAALTPLDADAVHDSICDHLRAGEDADQIPVERIVAPYLPAEMSA